MVIEHIKRNQRMGFDGDTLVYKVPLAEEVPVVEVQEELLLVEPDVEE